MSHKIEGHNGMRTTLRTLTVATIPVCLIISSWDTLRLYAPILAATLSIHKAFVLLRRFNGLGTSIERRGRRGAIQLRQLALRLSVASCILSLAAAGVAVARWDSGFLGLVSWTLYLSLMTLWLMADLFVDAACREIGVLRAPNERGIFSITFRGLTASFGLPNPLPWLTGWSDRPEPVTGFQALTMGIAFLVFLGAVGVDGPARLVLFAVPGIDLPESEERKGEDKESDSTQPGAEGEEDEPSQEQPNEDEHTGGDDGKGEPAEEGITGDEYCGENVLASISEQVRPALALALWRAWERKGADLIGCPEKIFQVDGIYYSLLSDGAENGLVVGWDRQGRVVFQNLVDFATNLLITGNLEGVTHRRKTGSGDFQIFRLNDGDCRLAIRKTFNDPYVLVSVLSTAIIITFSVESGSFPTITQLSGGNDAAFHVEFDPVLSETRLEPLDIREVDGERAVVVGTSISRDMEQRPCRGVRSFLELAKQRRVQRAAVTSQAGEA